MFPKGALLFNLKKKKKSFFLEICIYLCFKVCTPSAPSSLYCTEAELLCSNAHFLIPACLEASKRQQQKVFIFNRVFKKLHF